MPAFNEITKNIEEEKILKFLNSNKNFAFQITGIQEIIDKVFNDVEDKPQKTTLINALYSLFKQNKIKRFKYKKSIYYCSLDSDDIGEKVVAKKRKKVEKES
jgi:hypothetical protein